MLGTWRQVSAFTAGTSHLRDGLPCQDHCSSLALVDDDRHEVLVAVLSDGAGSASHSQVGAALACSLFESEIRDLLAAGGTIAEVGEEFGHGWLERLSAEVQLRAEEAGVPHREFACTFLGAVSGADSTVFLQVGDGGIVYSVAGTPDQFEVAGWPQEGEYANSTWFATEPGAAGKLAVTRVDGPVARLALFSDGLQRLALSFADRAAFAPFFLPLFRYLEGADQEGLAGMRAGLEDFLDSPPVNKRTDDDKSLVLATRLETRARALADGGAVVP